MSTWELYRTLSSKSRLAVIEALKERPLKYSEILKKAGLNTTDLSRQLQRLIRDSILEKGSSDRYQLTQFGKLAATSISTIKFLVDHQDFFNNHDLSIIPESLIDDIASLKKGVMVNSIYESIELQLEALASIQERSWVLTDDISPDWVGPTQKLVENGIDVRFIATPELAAKFKQEASPIIRARMQVRVMSSITMMLGYSDIHSTLCFPTLDGVPDRNHYIFGYDPGFRHWVFHCFKYHWKNAAPFSL